MEWLREYFIGFKDWLIEVLLWIPQQMFDLFLQAILGLINALPLPDFIVGTRIVDYIHPDILWFLSQSGLGIAMPIVGSAYVFYFLRRVLTLGIW